MKQNYIVAIGSYDGKRTAELQAALRQPPLVRELSEMIRMVGNPDFKVQEAASWLLKGVAESYQLLSSRDYLQWFIATKNSTHWATKLHFVQSVEYVALDDNKILDLFSWCTTNTKDDNKMVRAWSFHALVVMAKDNQSLIEAATKIIQDHDLELESAAVRVQIRRAKQELGL
jgi:hypothetical protein